MIPYDQKILVVDVETRHLNLSHRIEDYNSNKVWQVSWIESVGQKIIKEHDHYVDVPRLNLSNLVAKLTHFDSYEYERKKKPAAGVWEQVKKYIYDKDYLIVGQNILGFDCYLLDTLARQAGERIDYSLFLERIYDTRAFGLAYKNGIEKPQKGSMIEWQFKILSDRSLKGKVSQTALMKDLGITSSDDDSRHNAIVDCRDTLAIFQELKKRLKL